VWVEITTRALRGVLAGLIPLGHGQDRRHQVGKALADAGARLGDQMVFCW